MSHFGLMTGSGQFLGGSRKLPDLQPHLSHAGAVKTQPDGGHFWEGGGGALRSVHVRTYTISRAVAEG